MPYVRNTLILVLSVVLLSPSTARAQSTEQPLSELLPGMYFGSVLGNLGVFESVLPGSSRLININNQLEPAYRINDLLGAQLVGFPIGSSAGGFTWTFNRNLNAFEQQSESFGPMFTDRPLTIGRNRFNIGANFQRSTFDNLESRSLRDGDIRIYTGLALSGGRSLFIEDALDLELSANTVSVFGTYGVTDRLDVGFAVPFVQVKMKARLDSRFGDQTSVDPDVFFTDEREDSASGIGDVLVRAKYNIIPITGGGLAAGVDFRLPTGDEAELLGLAGGQAKIYMAAGGGSRSVSPHVNIGYTFSGESELAVDPESAVFAPSDEFNYAGGVDVSLSPRFTLSGDLIGRTLREFGRLTEVSSEFGSQYSEFQFETGNLHVVLGSVGSKFNLGGKGLITGNVLFPINKSGLRDNLTWVVGFEYSF